MRDDEEQPGDDAGHLKPGQTYYLELHVGNADGTLDLHMETPQASTNFDVVIQGAIEIAQSTGMDAWVYECRAIRKVQRGKVRVTTIK